MTQRWRLSRAQEAVGWLYRRLHSEGFDADPLSALDAFALAQAYLDCQVVEVPVLTERRGLETLHSDWGIDISGEAPKDDPLAGALFVTEKGDHRWIFLEAADHPRRHRWTIAHELGHLVREALPRIERAASAVGALLPQQSHQRLLRFGRCVLPGGGAAISAEAKRELDANDFAAELLMPAAGVKRVIAEHFGQGLRTSGDVEDLVRELARRYGVSHEAAERRVVRDLGIHPYGEGPNGDLFASA